MEGEHKLVEKRSGERGSALITTVYIVAILGVLSAAFISLSVSETTIAYKYRDAAAAFAIAEAGVERAISKLSIDPGWRVNRLNEEIGDGHFTISIIDGELDYSNQDKDKDDWKKNGTLAIYSTGYYKGSKRKIYLELDLFHNGKGPEQGKKPKGKPPWAGDGPPPWVPGPPPWHGGQGEYVFNLRLWREVYD
jgi:hypothetical protein